MCCFGDSSDPSRSLGSGSNVCGERDWDRAEPVHTARMRIGLQESVGRKIRKCNLCKWS